MAKTEFKSVTEYLATLPKETRAALERVRAAIRKAVPKGEEGISYQIPVLKLEGSAVIYFAGWKQHYSVYPATKKVLTTFEEELSGYEQSKGTIRFPLAEPVPTKLIAAIAKVRAQETVELLAERRAKRQVATKAKPTAKPTKGGKTPKKKSAKARKPATKRKLG